MCRNIRWSYIYNFTVKFQTLTAEWLVFVLQFVALKIQKDRPHLAKIQQKKHSSTSTVSGVHVPFAVRRFVKTVPKNRDGRLNTFMMIRRFQHCLHLGATRRVSWDMLNWNNLGVMTGTSRTPEYLPYGIPRIYRNGQNKISSVSLSRKKEISTRIYSPSG